MEKPFQISDLVVKLKGKGLDVAEDAAKISFEAIMEWIEESVALTENKMDDLALIALPKIKSIALSYIDKIDQKEG